MDYSISKYLNSWEILKKISDITCIVDPLQKKVIEYGNNETSAEDLRCYDFRGKNTICDNCISMRAFNDNTTYVKIEYQNDKTFMITAVPYDLADRKVVIEILKDITNGVFFNTNHIRDDAKLIEIHTLIENMNKLAFSDALTGLYNRRYILEKLPVDLINTALLAKDITIIMVDIDDFKDVNDKYGHLGGDLTLKRVAGILSGCIIRSSDWIARFGGEKFMICMPGAKREVAKALAENMRHALESTVIRYNENEFSITASFGIYSSKPIGNENVDELLQYADEKLYLAKKNGRNRIEY